MSGVESGRSDATRIDTIEARLAASETLCTVYREAIELAIEHTEGDRAGAVFDTLYDALATPSTQLNVSNQPTYGQLKIRLEKANETIEMQRSELFKLRDKESLSDRNPMG